MYDLTKAVTFGQLRSLNLLMRWKGESGKHLINRMYQPAFVSGLLTLGMWFGCWHLSVCFRKCNDP